MINKSTNKLYTEIIVECSTLFLNKAKDYGTAWRIMRPISVVDQIYIKLQRINTIITTQTQKIADCVEDEYVGIVNYCIIGLMQLEFGNTDVNDIPLNILEQKYTHQFNRAFELMTLKNHDYGEAWRNLSEESFIDLMLMKVYRMKQIINNKGITIVSEGLEANYLDIINYSVFSLILNYKKKDELI